MGSGSSKPYPFPVPGYEPPLPPTKPKSKKWTLTKKSKKSKYDDVIFPKYPTVRAPYGVPYYPQLQSTYPAYYAPVQMAVVQPVGVQQPMLAMPQYVPVTTYPTVPIQPAMAAPPVRPAQMPVPVTAPAAPAPPHPPVAPAPASVPASMPVPMPAPAPAPPLAPPIPQPSSTRMPEPYPTRTDRMPAVPLAPSITNTGPVIPPLPIGADIVIPPLPPPSIFNPEPIPERDRAPGSTRPRFRDFYRPVDPPISRLPPPMDEPVRPPPEPPFVTPMRNNPLPRLPADVWETSPYRQVLHNLPNDLTTLLDIQNREDVFLTEQHPPERSSSRLGGLFSSKKDKGKTPLRGLFRSLSTSGHDIQNEIGSSSSGRRGHHRSNTITSILIPAPTGSSTSMPQPSVPGVPSSVRSMGMPVPELGPPIRFDHTGEYADFVNHSNHRVLFGNKTYPTALHLLEAMKFTHRPDLQERIRVCGDVNDMYPLSASFQEHVRPDWGQVFLKTMEDVLYLKFKQHPTLRALLMGTGLAEVIYADANTFWGEGVEGEGANALGRALVRVRERLRQEGER